MKHLLLLASALIMLAGCSNTNSGELVGVRQKSNPFYQPDPHGMVFIPQGSFTMGAGGEDITYGQLNQPKTISVSGFFMDETEITNNEYREFVHYVRDSIARTMLGEVNPDVYLISTNEKTGEEYDPPHLNWKPAIEWNSKEQEVRDALEAMFLPDLERYFRRKEIDTRKLNYADRKSVV